MFAGGVVITKLALRLAVLLALCVAPALCEAHALLERSEPAAGVVIAVDRAPRSISLWFSEPVAVSSNAIAVLNGEPPLTPVP